MNLSNKLSRLWPAALDEKLRAIARSAERQQLRAYLVGGGVRDLCLNLPAGRDFDVTLVGGLARPVAEEVARSLNARLVSHPQFLTFTLYFPDETAWDLVTARRETYAHSGALPEVSVGTLREDLFRRDFTINAMAMSLSSENWGEVEDPFEGRADLSRKMLRVLHEQSFADDPTRLMRAARFAGRLKLELEKNTAAAIEEAVQDKFLTRISSERLRLEFDKNFAEKNYFPIAQLLQKWKILPQLWLPWGKLQPMLLKSLDRHFGREEDLAAARWAAHFWGGNVAQSQVLCREFRLNKEESQKVLECAEVWQDLLADKAVTELPHRFLHAMGETLLQRAAELAGSVSLKKRAKDYLRFCRTQPEVNGQDLQAWGYKPGPKFKEMLKLLTVEKFKGHLKNKAEEKKFLFDNFPGQ